MVGVFSVEHFLHSRRIDYPTAAFFLGVFSVTEKMNHDDLPARGTPSIRQMAKTPLVWVFGGF